MQKPRHLIKENVLNPIKVGNKGVYKRDRRRVRENEDCQKRGGRRGIRLFQTRNVKKKKSEVLHIQTTREKFKSRRKETVKEE